MALSKETLDFLVENRIQNSRSWFLGHRKEYQKYVKQPLLELAQQLAVCAAEIDPDIIAVPSRAVSRINRDTRFTKDKALYRDVMWCAFSRDKKVYDTPCALVLEFSPMGFRYGCGYWQTPPKTLEAMRELILADSPLFRKAEKARSSSSLFALEGDCYKRSRFPEQPERLRCWLDPGKIFPICTTARIFLCYFQTDCLLWCQRDSESFSRSMPFSKKRKTEHGKNGTLYKFI